MNEGPASAAITLTDLIALSEEMAALARSGVPLERGLLNLGEDIPGQLGRTTRRLAQRLERGEDLPQALAAEEGAFPRVYRTVVQAGLKSGRLPVALEGLAVAARRLAEFRSTIALAVVYPLTVFLLAYGLFVFFVVQLAPELQKAYDGFNIQRHPLLTALVWIGDSIVWWGPIIPVVVVVLAVIWWIQSGGAMLVNPSRSSIVLGWIPWVGKLLSSSRGAMFSEILALLLEHGVALDEALLLAVEVSGDPRMREPAQRLAQSIRNGQPLEGHLPGLPPILAWLLATQSQQQALVTAARHAADGYAWQAAHQAEKIRLLLPVFATLFVAGLVTLLYALTLYVPWSNLLRSLAQMSDFSHQRHKPPTPLERPRELIVACAPMRSNVNLSRIVRAAGCCGITRVIACGAARVDHKIARDGADTVEIEVHRTLPPVLERLREEGYELVGLEQTSGSTCLYDFGFQRKTALVVGNERQGLEDEVLSLVHRTVEIPVYGLPYAHNVATAAAMALYEYCRQYPNG